MTPVQYHQGRFPPDNLDWERLIPLIGSANRAIAGYDGVLSSVPNPSLLLSPLTTQEAVSSTRIEGTQASLGEVLEFEARGAYGDDDARSDDYREVLNYRVALTTAIQRLEELPLSQRLMCETHGILLQGVRGQNRGPGSYRRIQNHIGPPGVPIEKARYVPPPAQQVREKMNALEDYMHDDAPDVLVQLAVVHAEFEAVHPFLDGNGRLGRLIVPLFLKAKGVLSSPSFYLSGYLENHSDEYRDGLLLVSRDDDWTGWCAFFLRAITGQATENRVKAEKIQSLYESRKDWITDATRSQFSVRALDWFFNRPVFSTSQFIVDSEIPEPTARRILHVVRKQGLLKQIRTPRGRRPGVFAYPELLDIAEGNGIK